MGKTEHETNVDGEGDIQSENVRMRNQGIAS